MATRPVLMTQTVVLQLEIYLHSQIHDFEVEHVVRPACVQAFHIHGKFQVGTA